MKLILNRLKNVDAMQRMVMVHLLSRPFSLQVVNEFPKSGGSWVGQLLADSLDIPFPRNQRPPLRRCLMHGHYLNGFGMKKPVVVWRDGRDVMVSLYFHSYFKFKDHAVNEFHVDLYRHHFPFEDYDDIEKNLPRFIEQQFRTPLTPRFTWAMFARAWLAMPNRVDVTYENFRENTLDALKDTLVKLGAAQAALSDERLGKIVEKNSFATMKAQAPADGKHSFVRRGKVGGWRDYFSSEAEDIFHHYAGAELKALGYTL